MGPSRGQPRPAMVLVVVIMALALPVGGQEECKIDCTKNCNSADHQNYKPQRCDDCCLHKTDIGGTGNKDAQTNDRLESMETKVGHLTVMVGVLLGLVILLLLTIVALLLCPSSTKVLKGALPVFFRSNDESHASIEKRPAPLPIKVPNENKNSTVVRIANYHNNHSPLNKRMRPNGLVVHEDCAAQPDLQHGDLPRPRLPSESTCPDDSVNLPHTHKHAYDNFALSTSTLHDTTTSSTSTLGPAVSTNTLDTTLPSVNPTTPVLRQVSA